MANCEKLLDKASSSPANLRFVELCQLVECYGFELARTRGSHRIYKKARRPRLTVNLQPDENGKAKRYQIKQVLEIIDELSSD